jgi:hypothetical protein
MCIVANTIIVIAVRKIKMSANMYEKANFSILLTRHRGAVTTKTNIPVKKITKINLTDIDDINRLTKDTISHVLQISDGKKQEGDSKPILHQGNQEIRSIHSSFTHSCKCNISE